MIIFKQTSKRDVDLFYPNGNYLGTLSGEIEETKDRIIVRQGIIIFWKDQITIKGREEGGETE